jgi:hypothetical protein
MTMTKHHRRQAHRHHHNRLCDDCRAREETRLSAALETHMDGIMRDWNRVASLEEIRGCEIWYNVDEGTSCIGPRRVGDPPDLVRFTAINANASAAVARLLRAYVTDGVAH